MSNQITVEQRRTIAKQVGTMNIMSISGGRIKPLVDGVELPVSNGYHVQVVLDLASDTYTVTRVFRRAGKETTKGSKTNVYCDEVGEQAYRASCFRSYDETEW